MIRYYVTDRRQGDVLVYAARAIQSGVDMIQIREKDLPARELFVFVGDTHRLKVLVERPVLIEQEV